MKKNLFFFFILFGALNTSAQISFVGFDQPICSSPLAISYTYTNYTVGMGSSMTVGFKIYRNGAQVYDVNGSMGTGQWCSDLIFINDSTGFAVGACGGCGVYVIKTSDYGNTWTNIGSGPSGYLGLYVVNVNFAYLFSYNLWVTRCSDIEPPTSFIKDDTMNVDVYKTDTILGNALCNVDSLNAFIRNYAGDTIDYHINITSIPIAINELSSLNVIYGIYPNPAQNEITISGDLFSKAEIYNVQGEKIKEDNSKTINVENLSKGLYFIKIIDLDGKPHDSKFIKE